MRKISRLLWLLLLCCLLVSCTKKGEDPGDVTPPEEESLVVETLAVEIQKGGMSAQQLLQVTRELPDMLCQALEKQGVELGEVTVTVGASPSGTAAAVIGGGVDLAFLSTEDALLSGQTLTPILAAGEAVIDRGEEALWNGESNQLTGQEALTVGARTMICAAPTEYGVNLESRVESGAELSWDELSNARWGVLEEKSLLGYRAVSLWLADRYEGDTLADLPKVKQYPGYQELLRAAATGDIDLLVLRGDARLDYAAAWTLEPSRTAEDSGLSGFGRTDSIWDEVQVLGLTDRYYSMVAVVQPEQEVLTKPAFAKALKQALADLVENDPEGEAVFGINPYIQVDADAFSPLRRLLTLEGQDVS